MKNIGNCRGGIITCSQFLFATCNAPVRNGHLEIHVSDGRALIGSFNNIALQLTMDISVTRSKLSCNTTKSREKSLFSTFFKSLFYFSCSLQHKSLLHCRLQKCVIAHVLVFGNCQCNISCSKSCLVVVHSSFYFHVSIFATFFSP